MQQLGIAVYKNAIAIEMHLMIICESMETTALNEYHQFHQNCGESERINQKESTGKFARQASQETLKGAWTIYIYGCYYYKQCANIGIKVVVWSRSRLCLGSVMRFAIACEYNVRHMGVLVLFLKTIQVIRILGITKLSLSKYRSFLQVECVVVYEYWLRNIDSVEVQKYQGINLPTAPTGLSY